MDDVEFDRKSFGNSFSIPISLSTPEELSPVLYKLVFKATSRMRHKGYTAGGVHVAILYKDGCHWHKGEQFKYQMTYTPDIYKKAYRLLKQTPYRNRVHAVAVSCFNLEKQNTTQLDMFNDIEKRNQITKAVDKINDKYGEFIITPARLLGYEKYVQDRVSFGGVKELEDFITK